MKDPIQRGTKVIFGPCRLSYVHLMEKYVSPGDTEGKYSTAILIPKSETKTLEYIRAAIDEAVRAGVKEKWGGKQPKKLDIPLRDGDDKEDELYAGHYYLNAKCKTRPNVVDKLRNPITDEEEVYSGMWAYLSVSFYPYAVSGNSGVACGLNNVMKYKDDDHLGGRASAEADFAGFVDDDDDL